MGLPSERVIIPIVIILRSNSIPIYHLLNNRNPLPRGIPLNIVILPLY
jgi:hypothetical protein